jgi:tetratricopeptide (TPR) repeat protein
VLDIQAAISSGNLIEPTNANAWDYYQRFARENPSSDQTTRLRQLLSVALIDSAKKIVAGDLRVDNISNKLDEFRRAGQMFLRARTLSPQDSAIIHLEKLSAVQALVGLQFYEEAEKALTALQSQKLSAIENTLGISYLGSLNEWQAERAFKRAIELDSNWASPHYNLALLYRNRPGDEALNEFEKAAELDPTNVAVLAAFGDECFRRQQWVKAVNAYRKAIEFSHPDQTLHTKLGHALYSQGLRTEANREYQRASELRARQK